MESFLTLVIALGGIATGIGAIWTAVLARRQAQLTERSLAQTERNLTEQNERARLSFEQDMLSRLVDRFESPHFASRRRRAAKYILDNGFVEGAIVKVRRLNRSGWDVCNFYERLGDLQRLGALQTESVWNNFGTLARAYWALCEPAIENLRQQWEDPSYYEEFERLIRLGAELDREQGAGPRPQQQLHQLMEHETVVGEEATSSEEPITP